MSNKLSLSLYKGLLKASRRLELAAGAKTALQELQNLSLPVQLASEPSSLRQVIRHQFDCTRNYLPGNDLDALHDAGLKALSFLNLRATARTTASGPASASSSAGADASAFASPSPSGDEDSDEVEVVPEASSPVRYSIGQVFRHRKYGYKAVIVGYDTECKASDSWIQHTGVSNLPGGLSQPFYHCLVDIRDRPEAQVSYVAQDNIVMASSDFEELTAAEKTEKALERLVLHPLVLRYFEEYRAAEGRYVPSSSLLLASSPRDLPGGWQKLAAAAASSSSASDDEDDNSSSTSNRSGRGITTKGNN